MLTLIKAPSTIECLHSLGANRFVLDFHLTENAAAMCPVLNRIELAKLSRLCSEALRATQDQVDDPALLAAVRLHP